MKLSTSSQELLTQLQTATRVASTRSAIQALSGVQVLARDGAIELRATDMEIGLRLPLEGDVTREGAAVLPALLLVLLLIAEVVVGLTQEGSAAIGRLLIEATQLIVFAGLLWGIGDIALMLIESNHDLRAARILVGRLNANVQRLTEERPGRMPPPVH